MNDHNSKWVPAEDYPEALEILKAALANCEMLHRAEAKQKSIPRFQPDPETQKWHEKNTLRGLCRSLVIQRRSFPVSMEALH
ncbi:hypothetical protein RchiOBHm_Chr1g0368131 [Rosa chinensis]|uniref:Uncharacterized protein n=1 Tax=Rosa chinensis TaxID=74649 RepID=A0A2P6SKQ7_ROSCH|nr:hypothetical protein RchiOBHm_Chr1g0368131 [Rosa chinensis]